MNKAYLIFQNDNGISLTELVDLEYECFNAEIGKPINFTINGKVSKYTIDTNFENIDDLYNSIVYNIDIIQKEMLLNIEKQLK